MINIFLALAGLALTVPTPGGTTESAQARKSAPSKQSKTKPKPGKAKPDAKVKPKQETAKVDGVVWSAAADRIADWVAGSGDNASLPYIIVDKKAAALFLFDAKGKPIGKAPVLIGVAVGDNATPGVGSKNLAEIGPAEKTTPAGRFLAKYGMAAGHQRVLWVDYATSVALHPIPPGASKKERRPQRMLSPTPDDNRITFGCINVPLVFYNKSVRPLFQKKGGYVYVLPDTKSLEEVFPRVRLQALRNGGGAGQDTAMTRGDAL